MNYDDVPGNVPFLMVFLYGFLNAVCWICCLDGVRIRESKDADPIAVAWIDRGESSWIDESMSVVGCPWWIGCEL